MKTKEQTPLICILEGIVYMHRTRMASVNEFSGFDGCAVARRISAKECTLVEILGDKMQISPGRGA